MLKIVRAFFALNVEERVREVAHFENVCTQNLRAL